MGCVHLLCITMDKTHKRTDLCRGWGLLTCSFGGLVSDNLAFLLWGRCWAHMMEHPEWPRCKRDRGKRSLGPHISYKGVFSINGRLHCLEVPMTWKLHQLGIKASLQHRTSWGTLQISTTAQQCCGSISCAQFLSLLPTHD